MVPDEKTPNPLNICIDVAPSHRISQRKFCGFIVLMDGSTKMQFWILTRRHVIWPQSVKGRAFIKDCKGISDVISVLKFLYAREKK